MERLLAADGAMEALVDRPLEDVALPLLAAEATETRRPAALDPAQVVRDRIPVLVTYDMWKAGDVPSERTVVEFEANCTSRDPAAPAWRRVPLVSEQ